MTNVGFAYLHGFASGPHSKKGTGLAAAFEARGLHLELPDLNRPSLAALTLSGQLEAVDELVQAHQEISHWSFIGSSLGGWVAARYAELYPDRVARLVLLCPALGVMRRSTGLVRDALAHPETPRVRCPTLIIHGTCDRIIPIASSRAYAAAIPDVTLVEVDDEHELARSLPAIQTQTLAFLAP